MPIVQKVLKCSILNSLLDEIAIFVGKQRNYTFFELLFVRDSSINKIEGFHKRVATAVESFKVLHVFFYAENQVYSGKKDYITS